MQNWRTAWDGENTTQHAPVPPPLHPSFDLESIVRLAVEEDAGQLGDITTQATISRSTEAHAVFVAKADGIIAGLAVVDQTFAVVDRNVHVRWTVKDGDTVHRGQQFGTLKGSALSILTGERIALNFLQRMSGIATTTAAMVAAVQGTGCRVLDTRKTVPGLRTLDKWAVLIGGGCNHRQGLYDMVMIKDNHIAAAGGIAAAVHRTQEFLAAKKLKVPVEVECSTLQEVRQVMELLAHPGSCVTRIMLDNMAKYDSALPGGVDTSLLQQAVKCIRTGSPVEIEASGNVTLETAAAIAESGVDFVSCGALTHSVMALDISLKISTSS